MKFSAEFLDSVVAKDCRNVAADLMSAFVWDSSPQGSAAWFAVYNALNEIAAAKEKA